MPGSGKKEKSSQGVAPSEIGQAIELNSVYPRCPVMSKQSIPRGLGFEGRRLFRVLG
jgi:hypothetical protein